MKGFKTASISIDACFRQLVVEEVNSILKSQLTFIEPEDIEISYLRDSQDQDSNNFSHANIYCDIKVTYLGTNKNTKKVVEDMKYLLTAEDEPITKPKRKPKK